MRKRGRAFVSFAVGNVVAAVLTVTAYANGWGSNVGIGLLVIVAFMATVFGVAMTLYRLFPEREP